MTGSPLPLVALLLGVGAAYYYSTRDAQASTGTGEASGPPTNYLTAMNEAEYEQVKSRMQTSVRPVVMIKFRNSLGGDAITAAQSAAMAQARQYPQIWVVLIADGIGAGVAAQCGPDDGGVVLSASDNGGVGATVGDVVCWPQAADPDKVAQNINLAAVDAKNMAAQAPNA